MVPKQKTSQEESSGRGSLYKLAIPLPLSQRSFPDLFMKESAWSVRVALGAHITQTTARHAFNKGTSVTTAVCHNIRLFIPDPYWRNVVLTVSSSLMHCSECWNRNTETWIQIFNSAMSLLNHLDPVSIYLFISIHIPPFH